MSELDQIQAAVEAMEQAEWESAVSLLIGVLPAAEQAGPRQESTVRLLLAQAMHSGGQQVRALQQARSALGAAEQTDDRGLIWKCMALLASMEIIEAGRL